MTLELVASAAISVFLLIGMIFTLVGGIGLLKLADPMSRLHAPTKAGTLGIGSFLLASMLHSFTFGEGSFHELLIMAFLFVTAPVSANFLAKVNIHRRTCTSPPPPLVDDTWSTLADPDAARNPAEPAAKGQPSA